MAGPLAIVEGLVAGLLGAGPGVVRGLKAKADAAGPTGSTPEDDPTEALAAVLVASWFADDLAEQRTAAEYLTRRYPEGIGLLAGGGRVTLGLVRCSRETPPGALDVLRPIGLMPDARNLAMSAAASRSLATSDLGDAVAAEAIARSALARAEEWGLAGSRVGGSLFLALGNALAMQGRPQGGRPVPRESARVVGHAGHASSGARPHRPRVGIRRDRGDLEGPSRRPRGTPDRGCVSACRRAAAAARCR